MKEKAEVEAVVADFSRDCSQGVVVRREKGALGPRLRRWRRLPSITSFDHSASRDGLHLTEQVSVYGS